MVLTHNFIDAVVVAVALSALFKFATRRKERKNINKAKNKKKIKIKTFDLHFLRLFLSQTFRNTIIISTI